MKNIFLIFIVVGTLLLLPIEFAAQTANPGKSSLPEGSNKSDTLEKQKTSGELPLSRLYEYIKPDQDKTNRLPKLTEAQKASASGKKRMQIGMVRKLGQKVSKYAHGDTFTVADGKVWISQITSEDAIQTRLGFTKMNLPEGAKVFVYSATNPDDVYGPYEKSGETDSGDFWTPPVEGDSVIVEYIAPDESGSIINELPFQITKVSHIYRDPLNVSANKMADPPQFPSCHVNVPAGWSEVAKSVAYLHYVDDISGESVCTGTLLNPVAGDFDPILLTANHCINTTSEAQSLRAYWFYNSADYPSPAALPYSDGATILRTGTATDFTLLRIKGAIPLKEGIFYSGWDPTPPPAVGTPVAGIHHPNGSYKRFSSGNVISGYCTEGLPGPCANFIGVGWSAGITEGGSSGSGLWKVSGGNAYLVGNLYGGEKGCADRRDNYGKFSVTYPLISSFLQGGSDDAFDTGNGNDARGTAVGIGQGSFSNLIVKYLDSDWYAVTVPAGYRITATAGFTNANGNVDLRLYRGSESFPISSSESFTNSETVTHAATGGATTYYLNAYLYNGARNEYNLNISLQQVSTTTVRSPFDFDGDRKTDLSIFRPSSGQWWYLRSSDGGNRALQFGVSPDKLVPADYTGDGKTDIAFFRPSTNYWFILRSEDNSFYSFPFGAAGDVPAPADYDGDGRADPAVFRASTKTWFISRSSGGTTIQQFGQPGDVPAVADYDGDGRSDIAVYRPSSGQWWLLRSSLGAIAFQFGNSSDKPVQGDYTGDGKADIAFFRSSSREWFILRSENQTYYSFPFGISGDKPSPGDYDGDGKTDVAIFRPSNNTWYAQRSASGTLIQTFGQSGDVSVPNAFVP